MTTENIQKLADKFDAYETGMMDEEQELEFFQELVSSGMAWGLQGHYGRTAMRYIDAGLVFAPGSENQAPAV
jgi:hypothetical protein